MMFVQPPLYRTVSDRQLFEARQAMVNGADLTQAARMIGVLTRDLDLALWNRLGDSDDEIFPPPKEPMF